MYHRPIRGWVLGTGLSGGAVIAAAIMSLTTTPAAHADPTVSELLQDAQHYLNSGSDILTHAESELANNVLGNPDPLESVTISQQLDFQGSEQAFLDQLPAPGDISQADETNPSLINALEGLAGPLISGLAIMDANDHAINDAAAVFVPVVSNTVFAADGAVSAVNDPEIYLVDNTSVWTAFLDAGLVTGTS